MYMLPYKPIFIDSYEKIQSQLFEYIRSAINANVTNAFVVEQTEILNICPGLRIFLDKNNLHWDIARFFVTHSGDSLPIHLDGSAQYPKFLALNLPITGCDNSQMLWWDNVDIIKLVDQSGYSTFKVPILGGENKTIIHSLKLTSPHLVQVNIPHSVVNNQDQPRAILSLRFQPEPVHLWH